MTPTATGRLTKTPFPHLLVFMLDRQLEGSIFFVAGDGSEHIVYFTRGVPSKVKISYETTHLGRVLLELGLLDQGTLERSLEEFATRGGLHGQLLISIGAIDRAKLIAGLREQVLRRMVQLFESLDDNTSYAFYAGINLLESYGGPELTPVDPLRVLCRGVRVRPDHPHVEPTLARLGSAPLVFHPAASDLSRFGFSKEELAVIDLLRARPSSLSEILASGLLPERALKVLVYVLLITRNIDLGKREQMPVGVGQSMPQVTASSAGSDDVPSSRRPATIARVRLKSVPFMPGVQAAQEVPSTPQPPAPPDPPAPPSPRAASPAPGPTAPRAAPPAPAPPKAAPPASTPAKAAPPTATAAAPRAAPPAPAPPRAAPPVTTSATPRAAPPAPTASRAAPPAPPPAKAAAGPADTKSGGQRDTIKARAATIDKENFFIVLGVPENATLDVLQSAYFALAKQWHPDRLPAELADVKELAAKCFARMSEAFQTLSDPERRSTYQKLLKDNAGSAEEQEQVQQIIEAAIDFQKAEVFLKKRELESAEAHAKRAHMNDPEQGDYAAIYAWIMVLMRDKAGSKDYVDPLRLLTTAIDREPRCEKAYYYRALILQKQGKLNEAMRDFRKVNEINPRNIEAAREVRLHDMRGGKPGAPDADASPKEGKGGIRGSQPKATKSSGGLLGKLFKR